MDDIKDSTVVRMQKASVQGLVAFGSLSPAQVSNLPPSPNDRDPAVSGLILGSQAMTVDAAVLLAPILTSTSSQLAQQIKTLLPRKK